MVISCMVLNENGFWSLAVRGIHARQCRSYACKGSCRQGMHNAKAILFIARWLSILGQGASRPPQRGGAIAVLVFAAMDGVKHCNQHGVLWSDAVVLAPKWCRMVGALCSNHDGTGAIRKHRNGVFLPLNTAAGCSRFAQ